MKYFKLIPALILFPAFLFAQSNYKPGYIVNLKGDTLKGFIDYREWDATPVSINFKSSLTDKASTKYSPNDVDYFNIDKLESYKRYTGPISTDPTDLAQVTYGRDTSFRTASVFIKVLEKGSKLALYSYKDDLKKRYFIGESPGYAPEELIFKLYYDPKYDANSGLRGTSRTIEESGFRRQLIALAQKYNELNDKLDVFISRSEYTEDALLKVVSRINHISNTEYEKSHYSGSSFNLFAGVAVNINSTTPDPTGPYYAAGGGSNTSYGPGVSLGANFFANPATRKLQFRIELSANQGKYKSTYMNKVLPYVLAEASYDELALSVSPQVIFNFYNAENLKVFGGAGIVLSSYKFSNTYYGSANHDGSLASEAANNPFVFNTSDDSFIVKAGVQFTKNLAIYVSAQSGVANTQGGYFKLSSTAEQIGLNYFFK